LGCPLFVTISGRLASIIWMTKNATSGEGTMSARTTARLGWFLFVASVLLLVSALVLNLRPPQDADLAFTTGELVLGLGLLLFGWFGALVVSRQPCHPIGWVLCAFGVLGGVGSFASEYAIYGLRSHPGAVPGAATLAWFASWAFALELALLTALLLLFPTGRPPSPRWRWVLWLAGIGAGCSVVGALAMWPRRGIGLLQVFEGPEPVGALAILYDLGFWVSLAAVLAAIASLVVRFRRARGVERQQLKWVVYAVVLLLSASSSSSWRQTRSSNRNWSPTWYSPCLAR
jgi:hypothetical protein